MPEPSFGQLTAGLRGWTRDHDPTSAPPSNC